MGDIVGIFKKKDHKYIPKTKYSRLLYFVIFCNGHENYQGNMIVKRNENQYKLGQMPLLENM
jgi:hypothetical protein